MCRPRIKRGTGRGARLIAAAVAAIGLGISLAGCSDIYTDRRETIALSAGDAIAANEAAQIVDPWPPKSGDKNIAFNGQRMQCAVERYRLDKVGPAKDTQATPPPPSQSVVQITTGNNSSPNASAASDAPPADTCTAQ